MCECDASCSACFKLFPAPFNAQWQPLRAMMGESLARYHHRLKQQSWEHGSSSMDVRDSVFWRRLVAPRIEQLVTHGAAEGVHQSQWDPDAGRNRSALCIR